MKGKCTVKATSADANLGGRDFDNVIYEHFRKEFLEKHKVCACVWAYGRVAETEW